MNKLVIENVDTVILTKDTSDTAVLGDLLLGFESSSNCNLTLECPVATADTSTLLFTLVLGYLADDGSNVNVLDVTITDYADIITLHAALGAAIESHKPIRNNSFLTE